MAVLNLRGLDDQLVARLKSGAALAGMTLRDYCSAILSGRGMYADRSAGAQIIERGGYEAHAAPIKCSRVAQLVEQGDALGIPQCAGSSPASRAKHPKEKINVDSRDVCGSGSGSGRSGGNPSPDPARMVIFSDKPIKMGKVRASFGSLCPECSAMNGMHQRWCSKR